MSWPVADAMFCARVVVDALVAGGVTEVVLAPGSRSAPLAYAVAEAERAGRLRLHVRIDERTAAFLALGLAKGSGAPVAVITTSGTAAANLFPATLEAAYARVPLMLVTASRPRAMINTGANQTADQEQLFGRHVRGQATLADLVPDEPTWRFEIGRLLILATGRRTRQPGPVHLNVELSEPLTADSTARPGGSSTAVPKKWPRPPYPLDAAPRTVIIAGDLAPPDGRHLAQLAAVAQVPLLAEPSSNARQGESAMSTGRLLLASTLAESVQRVLVFGHPTLSRSVTRMLARTDVELVVVSPNADWVDPGRNASQVFDEVMFSGHPDTEWSARWRAADATLAASLARLLDQPSGLTGPGLAAGLWSMLRPVDVLVVGSSNPIRDLDLAPILGVPPAVYANRGLAGIDGTVSTAVGVALAVAGPTHALLGDLTALHDLTGLVIGPGEPRPDLRLVIANDDGGSIFATLEHGAPERAATFERLFGTPTRVDFAALAAGVGADHRRVESGPALAEALARPPRGLEVVEAVVDRSNRRALDAAITALAATL